MGLLWYLRPNCLYFTACVYKLLWQYMIQCDIFQLRLYLMSRYTKYCCSIFFWKSSVGSLYILVCFMTSYFILISAFSCLKYGISKISYDDHWNPDMFVSFWNIWMFCLPAAQHEVSLLCSQNHLCNWSRATWIQHKSS